MTIRQKEKVFFWGHGLHIEKVVAGWLSGMVTELKSEKIVIKNGAYFKKSAIMEVNVFNN